MAEAAFAHRTAIAPLFAGGAAAAIAIGASGEVAGLRTPVLALTAAVALCAGVAACGNPRLACLWGVGLTAPIGVAKRFHPMPHMGGAGAYAIEAVDPFLAALLLFQLRDAWRNRRAGLRLPPEALGPAGLLLLGLLHALVGPYRHLALAETVQIGKSLLLLLLLTNELTRVRRFLHLFAALCCGLAAQSAVGIAQFAKKGDIGLQFLGEATMTTLEYANRATYMDGGATFRVGGLLGHPNILAGFIAMLAPLLLAMLMTRLRADVRIAIVSVLTLALIALLLTLSRSGWLSFALAVPLTIGLMLRDRHARRRALTLTAATLAPGLIAALAAAPVLLRRFTQSDPGAVDFRWEWMGVAWGMVQDHPLLGVGLNSFVQHLPGRTDHGGVEGLTRDFGPNWPVVHDIYLLIWAEQGSIGLACFLLMVAMLLRAAWRNARGCTDPVLRALNAGALAGLCANLLDGLGSFFLRQMPGARLFWIVAAIIVATRIWQARNGAPRRGAA